MPDIKRVVDSRRLSEVLFDSKVLEFVFLLKSVDFQYLNKRVFPVNQQKLVKMSEKLKVMKYNQLMMTALGVCPKSFAASSPSLRWLHTLSPPFMAFFLIVSVGSAGRFILEGSTRLSFICEALIVLIGGIQSFLAFVNMLRKINIIGRMYLRLQEIVDHGLF